MSSEKYVDVEMEVALKLVRRVDQALAGILMPKIEARYPEFEEPRLENARQAIEDARNIGALVLQDLPGEVRG